MWRWPWRWKSRSSIFKRFQQLYFSDLTIKLCDYQWMGCFWGKALKEDTLGNVTMILKENHRISSRDGNRTCTKGQLYIETWLGGRAPLPIKWSSWSLAVLCAVFVPVSRVCAMLFPVFVSCYPGYIQFELDHRLLFTRTSLQCYMWVFIEKRRLYNRIKYPDTTIWRVCLSCLYS